ncbi:MAG: hypothetical protein V1816_09075 [Pseudomonadota bacterium]
MKWSIFFELKKIRNNTISDGQVLGIIRWPLTDIAMNLVEPTNLEVKTRAEQFALAGSVINAIPEVCAAPAGIFHFPVFAPFRERF